MGRLPLMFAGRQITFRVPYSMHGELTVPPSNNGFAYPVGTFLHNVDKPFEIHRMIPRVTGLAADSTVLEPQPDTLEKRIRLNIADTSKNERLTKTSSLIENLITANRRTWEWEDPYTIVRSEGFEITVDSLTYPSVCILGSSCDAFTLTAVSFARVSIEFQGYLVVVAPPSETR
jgi:hypothetical protein